MSEANMRTKTVNSALEAIARKNKGLLRPDDVIAAAEAEGHPLHACFEWDDAQAGIEYRRWQARCLINSVRLETEDGERVLHAPMWVHDPTAEEQGYRQVTRLRSERERAGEVLLNEFGRADHALERAQALAQFFGLQGDVRKVRQTVARMVKRVPVTEDE